MARPRIKVEGMRCLLYLESRIIVTLEQWGRMNPPVSKSVVVEMLVREKMATTGAPVPSSRPLSPGMQELRTPFSGQGKVFAASMSDAQMLAIKAEEVVEKGNVSGEGQAAHAHPARKPASAKSPKTKP